MLQYLRILTWFLLTFGVAGLFSAWFGIDIGIGIGPPVVGLMAVQVVLAGLILWGFRLVKQGKLHPQVLTAGAIVVIVVYIVGGQIWLNVAKPERGANVPESSESVSEEPPRT